MKPIIYQVLVRLAGNRKKSGKPYGTIEENGCGKFNDLSQHFLNEIKAFGATHLWITGVISHATCTDYSAFGLPANHPMAVKGRAGSPYAIRDYYDVDPDLAVDVNRRMEEFEAMIERCKKAGLDPIIDFVPNHVAREYHSNVQPDEISNLGEHDRRESAFHPMNNFYYIPGQSLQLPEEVKNLPYVRESTVGPYSENPAKVTGNDQFTPFPGINDWYETVKLNYGVDYQAGGKQSFDPIPDTWQKMLHILHFWAGKGIMGFRCDMAEMVPLAFWKWAIRQIRSAYPQMLFIAEIYNPRAYRSYHEVGGFDYLYDKEGLYNTLREVITGKQPASCLTRVWQNLEGLDAPMLRFLENHDEQRIASQHFAGDAKAGIPGMAVAALMHQGPLMIYFGQELGENASGASGFSGDDGRTTLFDYFHVPAFLNWFNDGHCNKLNLTRAQISLREKYRILLTLTKDPLISQGQFYDLMWFNLGKPGFDERYLYCFLRWEAGKAWLIVSSFCPSNNILTTIRIPSHFFEISGINQAESLALKTIHGLPVLPGKVSPARAENHGVAMEIEPNNFIVILLEAQQE